MHYGKVTKETSTKNLGAQKVTFTVPQVDTLAELTQLYGGEQEIVSRWNKILARSAYQSSMIRLKDHEATTLEQFNADMQSEVEATKNYKPEATGGMSKTAKAENADKVLALATGDRDKFLKMSPEEILALLTGQVAEAA